MLVCGVRKYKAAFLELPFENKEFSVATSPSFYSACLMRLEWLNTGSKRLASKYS